MLKRNQPLAIFMEGATTDPRGKMGFGVIRYSPNPIVCVIDSTHAGSDMSKVARMQKAVPIVGSVREARELGAEVLVLGIAPPGGLIPPEWMPEMDTAIDLGMSLLNGLHDLLGPRYPNLPEGQWVWDVRVEPPDLMPATGAAAHLTNRRLLMVGTDMAVGKMTAGLEIVRIARERGVRTEFVATGQIGITVTGRGVPLDAVRMDYAAGAIEREVLAAADADLVIIEGQGSLAHPASSATLPLLRGSMPTHLVLCHRAGQTHIWREPQFPIPPLRDLVALYQDLASISGSFPRPVLAGVALNTGHLESDEEALDACRRIEEELGVPCVDPVRHGAERLMV